MMILNNHNVKDDNLLILSSTAFEMGVPSPPSLFADSARGQTGTGTGEYMPLYDSREPGHKRKKLLRWLLWFTTYLLFLPIAIYNLAKLSQFVTLGDNWGFERDYPEFTSGEVVRCANRHTDWSERQKSTSVSAITSFLNIEPPYYQDTTFSLSSEADLLYFVSHGSLVSGNVNINAEPTGGQDSISVDLRAYYWSESALDYVSVCEIKSRGVGEGSDRKVKQGVAIFSPRKRFPRARRNVVFDIKIGLPARSYAALTADYSNFRIGLSGLEEKTFFDAITVKTSNSRITVDGVETKHGLFRTSNVPIQGKFNSSGNLVLVTSNAPIDADISLYGNNSEHPTTANVRTSNARINTSLSLYTSPSFSPSSTDTGSFSAQLFTTNGPNTLKVLSHPLNSPLSLFLKTSNAPSKASLHPSFEGFFGLQSSNTISPKVTLHDEGKEDPSGEGRERNVKVDYQSKDRVVGRTWWGGEEDWEDLEDWKDEGNDEDIWKDQEKGKGRRGIVIQTSNSPIELELTGAE